MTKKRTRKLLKKLKSNSKAALHSGKQFSGTTRDGVKVKFNNKHKSKRQQKTKPKVVIEQDDDTEPLNATARRDNADLKKRKRGDVAEQEVDASTMSIDEFLAGAFKEFQNEENEESDKEEDSDEEHSDDEEEDANDAEADSDDVDSAVDADAGASTGKKQKDKDADDNGTSDEEEGDSDVDEAEAHQADLEKLKETDPEFYEHLQKNASDLLNFNDPTTNEEDAVEEKQDDMTQEKKNTNILTSVTLKNLEQQAFEKGSVKALKQLLQAFKAGCHMGDDAPNKTQKFTIVSPAVFQTLIVSVLKNLHITLSKNLKLSTLQSKISQKATFSFSSLGGKFKRYDKMVKDFLKSFTHLLTTSTDSSMIQFLLQQGRNYGIYFIAYKKLCAKYLKCLVTLWGTHENEIVRIISFLRIRQLAVEGPLLEKCIKSCYLSFVRNSKFSNSELEADKTAILAKCFVEFCSIDLVVAYQLAFVYIRQLALHLRTALLSKSDESIRNVYSWQFLHCLRLWGSVLSAYPGTTASTQQENKSDQQLRPLIYPLVQVILGTIQLVPSTQYIPLRFHLIAILNSLSRTSKLYIPTASHLLDIFGSTTDLLRKKPTASTKTIPNLKYAIRLKKQDLSTHVCQQAIVTEAVVLLTNHFNAYKYSIGFPELTYPAKTTLKQFIRKTRKKEWKILISELLDKLENWKQKVLKKRRESKFGPGSVTRLEAFASAMERAEHDMAEAEKSAVPVPSVESALQKEKEQKEMQQGKNKKLKLDKKEDKKTEENAEVEEDENEDSEDQVEDLVMSDSESESE